MVERVFAACAPGLEPTLAAELRALGLEARPTPGGADASGEAALAAACIGSRVAETVLLRVYEGPERGVAAAVAAARRRHGAEAELAVRRRGGTVTVSLDAAGEPLHRRGWRARIGAAPLRETLAAGLLLAAGYDGSRPFLDPMCGSGTLLLEAAAIAMGRAPGLHRTFAFERWPGYDPDAARRVRARLAALERPAPAPIFGSDRNGGAVRLATKNVLGAGLDGTVRIERREAAEVEPPGGPGLLASNPPYGVRLTHDVVPAWRSLGLLISRLPGWRAAVLGPAPGTGEARACADALGRAATAGVALRNGGLRCQLLVFDLPPFVDEP